VINYFSKKYRIPNLFLAILVFSFLCACELENPWIKEIMQEKTVSFNTNGGSSVPSQTLYAGERVKRPANPYKANSVFQDWYKDNGTFLEPYDFSFVPKQDMTLYARWDTSEVVTPPGNVPTFDSVDELKAWLQAQPDNTATDTYKIKLNVSKMFSNASDGKPISTLDSSIAEIIDTCQKYVSIELVGNTLTTIGDSAFNSCEYLTGITIPNSVTSIGDYAFNSCSSLTSVTILQGVTSIGNYTFRNCSSLTSVTFEGANVIIFGDQWVVDAENTTSLQAAYTTNPGGGIGTYTRPDTTSNEWTRKP